MLVRERNPGALSRDIESTNGSIQYSSHLFTKGRDFPERSRQTGVVENNGARLRGLLQQVRSVLVPLLQHTLFPQRVYKPLSD
ncbi:hypothetical protein J6590_046730 [Homalodisca vitripennis]|nr:hypothetical protein J6590_046730 [Homalodisca vitripennis]